MNHKEFQSELQKTCHMDHHQCATLLSALQKLMVQAAIDQIPVTVHGLGTFTSHKHPEYIQEDEQTGQQTLFPPRISYRMQGVSTSQHNADADQGVASELAEYVQMPYEAVAAFLQAMAHIIVSHVDNHEEVEIHGLGTFHRVEAHQAELQRIAFSCDEQMKQQVNAPFSCFEPVVIREGRQPEMPAAFVPMPEMPAVEPDESNEDAAEAPGEPDESAEEVAVASGEPDDKAVDTAEASDEPAAGSAAQDTTRDNSEEEAHEEKPRRTLLYSVIATVSVACIALAIYLGMQHWGGEMYVEAELAEPEYVTDYVVLDEEQPTDSATALVEAESEPVEQEEEPEPVEQEEEAEQAQPEAGTKPVEQPKVAEPAKPAEQPKVAEKQAPKVFHRLTGSDGQPVTVTLNQGERLTIVALNQYGDKAFWPYIFEVNSDRIKAPNLVQAGMKLYLPDPKYYDIDANSEESLRKAKNRAAQLLKN